MAKNPWREPKPLLIWVMVALVLWLVIPFCVQMGVNVYGWTHPGADLSYEPGVFPPYAWHGLVGLLLGAGIVLWICHWQRLGYLWLAATILVCGPLLLFLSGVLGFILPVLISPIIGALIFTPRGSKKKP